MPSVFRANISVDYRNQAGVLRNVAMEVGEGEVLGLVGQSGSGKTTFVMAALGLLDRSSAKVKGTVVVNGAELVAKKERDLRGIRGKLVSLIPQNPAAALNPALRLGTQFREAWLAHNKLWKNKGVERARWLLARCGLPSDDQFLRRYPDQISVGEAQRVLISMALLHEPALLIADEPTSALDLVIQQEIIDLLARLASETHMSMIFISHDLLAVASLCHKIAILHEGTIVECGKTRDVLASPVHPYTQLLLAAIPKADISPLHTH
jgi:peptide/nickel transport system ATP-binding protein